MRHLIFISIFIFSTSFGISQNLVTNGDFENNGQPDCASWYDYCKQELTYLCDTLIPGNPCDVDFYKDAPNAGGIWSLGCTGIGNGFPATASTYITGQSGTHHYLLNVWMKDDGQAFGGTNVEIRSNGNSVLQKSIMADSPDWTFYSVKDTLTLQPTDSIQITLSAFAAGPAFGNIYFDEVEFILLDSLTSVSDFNHNHSIQVSVFPNPAKEYITFTLQDQHTEHTIYLYTLTGQLIQTLFTSDQSIAIAMKDLDSGVYFYRVESSKGKMNIAQGRFVVE